MKIVTAAVGLAALAAVRSLSAATVYDATGFESPKFTTGQLDGQDNGLWIQSGGDATTGTALVQNSFVYRGTQAVTVSRNTSSTLGGDKRYWPNTPSITPTAASNLVVTSWDMYVVPNTTAGVGTGPFFGIESYDQNTNLIAGAGVDATTGEILFADPAFGGGFNNTTADAVVSLNAWHHYELSLNYTTDTATVYVDNVPKQVVTSFDTAGVTQFSDSDLSAIATSNEPPNQIGKAYFDNYLVVNNAAPTAVIWDGSPSPGIQDGVGVWDTTTANFSDGATNYPWTNGTTLDATFGVGNGSAGIISLGTNITGRSITFNNASSGNYTINGAGFALALGNGATITTNANATILAPINVTGAFTKAGSAGLNQIGSVTASGTATVAAGTLTLTGGTFTAPLLQVSSGATFNLSTGTLAATTPLTINAGGVANLIPGTSGIVTRKLGQVTLGANTGSTPNGQINVVAAPLHTNRQFVMVSGLTVAGSTNAWQGQIDLANNDLDVQNGDLATITNLIATGYANSAWNGNGITSSSARTDSTHRTSLGVILNGTSYGTAAGSLGSFDNQNPAATDVLVKYTYSGDANLDGNVDGSDYARIDAGYGTSATGWANGDFNYDGVIDGSDYALIDNAFNSQSINLSTSALVATSTAQSAPVPEPATSTLVLMATASLSVRRQKSRRVDQ